MFHNILNPIHHSAIRRSAMAIMLKTINIKFNGKLSVSHYYTDENTDTEHVLMSMENGFRVLDIRRTKEEFWVSTVDAGMGEINLYGNNHTGIAESKNPRYLTTVVCNTGKEANKKIHKSITHAIDSHLNTVFNAMTTSVREIKRQTRTPTYQSSDVSALLDTILGNGQIINLPTDIMQRLESAFNDFRGASTAQSDYEKRVANVFSTDKWFIGLSPFHGQDNYFVGAFDINKFKDAVKINESFGTRLSVDSIAFTIPISCYRSISDAPDAFRDELTAALTMSKLFLDKNYSHLKKKDAAGFIPASGGFIFDDNAGIVVWNRAGTMYMLIDK